MQITYINHSSFLVQASEYSAVFDYWAGQTGESPENPGLLSIVPTDRPFYVFVSHHHKDHFSPAVFGWCLRHPDVRYVLSYDTARFARHYLNPASHYKGIKPDPSKVSVMRPGDRWSDGIVDVEAFGSTDCGCSWLVAPSSVSGDEREAQSVFHAGDLNAWIWIDESTPEEVREATEAFEAVLDSIAGRLSRIGYCMFPVDSRIGTHWYMGAEMLVRKLRIDRFFPMHFTLGDNEGELRRRVADACSFGLYANRAYGEYIALTTPYTSFLSPIG